MLTLRYCLLSPNPNSVGSVEGQVTTIVLFGSDEYALDELGESIRNVFKVLNNLLRQPFVFHGAGALDVYLANHLKKKVNSC
jgi:chaperonin GroEL (HSP60 family)